MKLRGLNGWQRLGLISCLISALALAYLGKLEFEVVEAKRELSMIERTKVQPGEDPCSGLTLEASECAAWTAHLNQTATNHSSMQRESIAWKKEDRDEARKRVLAVHVILALAWLVLWIGAGFRRKESAV